LRAWRGPIGVAVQDITPLGPDGRVLPIRTRNWGAADWDVAEGLHQPLSCRVIVFGDPPLVLASLDLGWWRSPRHEEAFRGEVLSLLSLPPERVILHLTHTHSGPSLDPDEEGLPGGTEAREYLQRLPSLVAGAVRRALESREDSLLDWGWAGCRLARKREWLQDGRWVVGSGQEEPDENRVWVGRVSVKEKLVASLIHYACHPTTLHWGCRLLSPDYPGEARSVVEEETGAPCLFLQGCSADLGPGLGFTEDPRAAERNGRQVGFAALAALAGLPSPGVRSVPSQVVASGAPILLSRLEPVEPLCGVESTLIKVPAQEAPCPTDESGVGEAAKERALRLRKRHDGLPSDGFPVWVWKLGDTRIIGIPGEAPSGLQTVLRRAFPKLAILPLNVANGWLGYLMPKEESRAGSYTHQTSCWMPGLYESLEETLIGAMK
jgi:hypothetical protein